ncbi:MAG TPA: thioredoxin [Blastocatellia bacterium]|nr:thioredoxin [Blastocatellia bacterium]
MSAASVTQLVRCSACGRTNRVEMNPKVAGLEPVCGQCKSPLVIAAGPLIVTDANFGSVVEKSPLPVLVDLWAPWCGPCRMLAPVIEQLAAELAGRVRVVKLNIDENPITSSRFGVRNIPTLLIMDQGREISRLLGVRPKEEILRALQSVL